MWRAAARGLSRCARSSWWLSFVGLVALIAAFMATKGGGRSGPAPRSAAKRPKQSGGSPVDISLTVSPVKDPKGKIVCASKIARDITERKRAEQRQHLPLRELDHRGKNQFALASGVVAISAPSAAMPAVLASAVRDRL